MKRRQLLLGIGASALVAPWLLRKAQAAESKADSDKSVVIVEMLFVQSADSVELNNNILKLTGINPATIYFSDRPDRVVGHEPTEDFVDDWNKGENSFAKNPPNAALSVLTGTTPQEVILTLKNPRLEKNKLIYDVKVLEGNKSLKGNIVSLFIDPVGMPLSPTSVAGVHRRRRRRAVRRH